MILKLKMKNLIIFNAIIKIIRIGKYKCLMKQKTFYIKKMEIA